MHLFSKNPVWFLRKSGPRKLIFTVTQNNDESRENFDENSHSKVDLSGKKLKSSNFIFVVAIHFIIVVAIHSIICHSIIIL